MTVYPFGLEEHVYSGSGTNQFNTYYYVLGGQLIGDLNPNNTYYLLTDALGSIVSTISWPAGGASVQGNQLFGPYGNGRYSAGNLTTAKGFTGQYNDGLTGLDSFHARYYDPVVGVFLSPDSVQGNASGMNPYGYVGGNPETQTDPSGQRFTTAQEPPPPAPVVSPGLWPLLLPFLGPWLGVGILWATSAIIMQAPQPQVSQPSANTPQPQPVPTPTLPTTGCCAISGGIAVNSALLAKYGISDLLPTPSGPQPQPGTGGQGGKPPISLPTAASPQPCSFTPDTPVTTERGKEPIGEVQVGDKVLAYNPKTHKREDEPVLHVWTHTDHDPVDLTLTTTTPASKDKPATHTSEVLHTTSEHPFFTQEHGFVAAGKLKLGMHVLRADGRVGVITGWKVVPGKQLMYNLEVAQDHTYTVGQGQWVVHNQCKSQDLKKAMEANGIQFQPGQEAHHVIPCSVYNQGHDLLTQAGSLFDPNAAYNGRAMYSKQFAYEAMNEMEPYHANSPRYAVRVRAMMDAEYQRLQSNGLTSPQDAFNSLMGIIDQLNQWINDIGVFSVMFQTSCGLY